MPRHGLRPWPRRDTGQFTPADRGPLGANGHFAMKALFALLAAWLLPVPVAAQVPRDSITDLARRWAPRWATVTCGDRGPRGEFIRPPQLYCGWQVASPEVLGVHVSTAFSGLSLATWERRFPTASDAARLVDSLNTALVAAGFLSRRCTSLPGSRPELQAMLWETKAMVVYLLRSGSDAGTRVVTMAMVPASLPALVRERCKGSA
jgi:hypothetical protein